MKKILVFFALAVVIFSCSDSGNVANLVDKSFSDEVPLMGNLSFTFDKDIAQDQMLNTWDTLEYIEFDPEIKGRFMWTAKNTLMFSPVRQLIPATKYKGKLTKQIVKGTELSLGDERSFEFHTPYLQLDNVNAYWATENNDPSQASIHFDLGFNYMVKPGNVAELLTVSIEGQEQDFVLTSEELSENVTLYIPGIKPEDKTLNGSILISKGLKAANGNIVTEENLSMEVSLASPYKLIIQDVVSDHDGSNGVITVYTSQRVDEGMLRNFLDISPNVKYELSVENQSFTIKSEQFDVQEIYQLVIKQDLKGQIGGSLKYEYSQDISFGKLQPAIKFLDKKNVYLSAKGSRDIEVNITSVEEVTVTVTKVYENNILSFIGNQYYYYDSYGSDYYDDYYYDDYYYDDYYYDDYSNSAGNLGDIIHEETILTRELPKKGSNRILKLNFEDKIKDFNGLYVVKIASKEDYWLKATKNIAVSDIGLIVKEGKNSLAVFANSIKTSDPLSNVKISFIGRNNQVAGTVTTDENGVAVFDQKDLPAAGFKVKLITASLSGDFNYVLFNQAKINTSNFDIGGKYENNSGYDAFMYGDRDIYRPGDTLYLSAIIRDFEWNTPSPIPVKLELISPEGKKVTTIRKTLNSQGAFEAAIPTSPSYMTGSYYFLLSTGNDIVIGTKYINIEEFIPDRIKVNVETDKEEMTVNEYVALKINAMNLFGPPAAGRNYEVDQSISKRYFYPKENNDYFYNLSGTETYFKRNFRDGTTDEDGNATETFSIPGHYANMGILESDFFVTVFDETGRPVNKRTVVTINTQDVFLGMKREYSYFRTGQEIKIPLIAVDKKGKALNNVKADIQLIKHEYKTVLNKSDGYFRYRSEHEEILLEDKQIEISGLGSYFAFVPELSGNYEIRLSLPGVNTYVKNSFYCYGYGRTSLSSFQVNNEGQIDIELDKENYFVGDKAHVIMKTPFAGKVLVTVETNKIINHFYVNTDKRAASFDLDITDEYVPNIYITATLFKPHVKSDLPFTVAHGIVPLLVENPDNKLPISIEANTQSRSRTKQKVTVKSKANSMVTIAVVDEGILQLTGFRTPDPYGHFYARRALGVNQYDIYPYLFPEISSSSTGGGGMSMEKRVNPMQNKRVKLLAYWSGILQTDGSGEAEFEFYIPQFSGDLRIMAVNYRDKAFASTHVNMKVADPVVISTALPRFLSPKDTVIMAVSLANTTEKKNNCDVEVEIEGPVEVVGKKKISADLKANAESRVEFRLAVKPQIGNAKIKVVADAFGESFVNETEISIRPASPLQKVNGSGIIKAGEKGNFVISAESFLPQSVDRKIVVSKSPLIQFTDDLEYLVRYPYGCVEQTVSSAFPQIYYNDIVRDLYKSKGLDKNPAYNVNEAINKLMLMQLYNGGLTYWPQGGTESWWGTVYAAHFLVEAKKAGYQVDDSFLDKIFDYMKMKLKSKEYETYYYNGNLQKRITPKTVPYSLYVMALAGDPDKSMMNYYKSNLNYLSLDGKYLLAAAYALSGDKKKYKEILPQAFEGEISKTSLGGSFYSYIRDEAIALNVLLEVEPENSQVGIMAKHISDALKNRYYLNTQERSFSFLALGKIAKKSAGSNITATIECNGKKVGSFDNKPITLTTKMLSGNEIKINTEGTGDLYYFWEAEGISADGSYNENDSYLAVRKEFYDRYGNRITGNTFRQNDLVVIKLSLKSLTNTTVENVAISDIIPAGFEIENERISSTANLTWLSNKGWPQYKDIRDDRINLFDNAGSYGKNYYYMVRAVTPGTFQMGPVGADAMYDGEYHSYNGGGVIKILAK